MPSKENRRKDKSSKEEGEVNENYTNSQKHNGAHPFDAGGASEGVDSNVNSHTHNQARGGGSNQGKASTSPKPTRKPTFEALTATANGTLQTLKEAEEKIKTLCSVVTLHANDLEKIDDTHRRLQESEEACKQKDGIIGRQENAILALNNIESRTMAQSKQEALKIEQEKLLLIQEREKMEQEKKKQDKRSAVVAAERNDKIDKEMERLTKHHNEVHEKRQQDLTAEFALKFDENDRRAKTFEAEKLRILTEVEDRNQQIKGLMEALKTSTDQCEMLDITKKSFKKELLDRQAELEAMKKEFDIEFQAIDYLYVILPYTSGENLELKQIQ
jgi:chromosome segregation ATPase